MTTEPWKTVEQMNTEACHNLKLCMQLLPGARVRHGRETDEVHQAVFDVTGEGVRILGVEIWDEYREDVLFVPWHAVSLVIPPALDDE